MTTLSNPRSKPADPSFLSVEDVFELQNKNFKQMIKVVFDSHPFYRKLFTEEGLDVDTLSLSNFDLLPLTSKSDLSEHFEDFKLQLTGSSFDPLWDIAYTSGSTSAPIPIYQTSRDFRAILLAQRRMAEIRGMDSTDRILNLFPLTQYPHGAWTRANHAAATLGAYVACGMSGSPDEEFDATRSMLDVVKLAARLNPTVFWGVPSYIKKVFDRLALENLTVPDLRMIAVSGEACTDAMKSDLVALAKKVGANAVVSNSLGASELQCGLVECVDGIGFHNPAPELFYFAVVDENGCEVDEDSFGTLSVTHLDRRGTTLVKYLLGDQVKLTRSSCPACGRAGGRIVGHQGRAGSLVKIRGQLVDRGALERCIGEFSGVIDYMIRVKKVDPLDGLSEDLLNIEVATSISGNTDAFCLELAQSVKKQINVSPAIEVVELNDLSIENVSIKTTKFRDERK